MTNSFDTNNTSDSCKIIESIFLDRYDSKKKQITFKREDIKKTAISLKIPVPKNLGGVIYDYKYRCEFPESIKKTAPKNKYWRLTNIGKGEYCFIIDSLPPFIFPKENQQIIPIPDSTPNLVKKYSNEDEQALLAIIRYNRILDLFQGMVCFTLQNHLRTTVEGIGQIETDEIYVGIDKTGQEYIFPVQAKGHNDKLGIAQMEQDIELCRKKYPQLICKSIACQFINQTTVAMFEFQKKGNKPIKMTNEVHYQLI